MYSEDRIVFPNLNGLRFVAALMVIVNHIEIMKAQHSIFNFSHVGFFKNLGQVGVTLFFVLSGFLITFLLLREKERYSRISVRSFYMRRVLRIWPLYYLLVGVGFFLLPQIDFFFSKSFLDGINTDFETKILLFLLILPNVAYTVFTPIPFLSPTWSIGVEEQFYIIWPLLLKYTDKFLSVLITIVCLFFLLSNGYGGDFLEYANRILHFAAPTEANFLAKSVDKFFNSFRIGCMAIGGIGAFILFQKQRLLEIVFKKEVQYFFLLAIGSFLIMGFSIPHEIYSLLFIGLILNLAANPHSIIKLNLPWLDYLGKISYGLYMFHSIAIFVVLKILAELQGKMSGWVDNLIIYSVSILFTIGMAHLSYWFYEKQFLALKHAYTKVHSSDR